MQALDSFIIELDKHVNDTITTDSGLELYVDTRFDEFKYRATEAKVHGTPARYETGVRPGDTLYFHHHVVLDKGQIMPGEENKYLVFYNEVQASTNQAIAYKDQNTEEVKTLYGWALLEPFEEVEEEDEGVIKLVTLKENPVTKGVVSMDIEELSLIKGDVVGFKKNRDYRIKIDGKEYYRVAISEILYKQV